MKRIPTIAVIQTAWGSKFGGLNSFSTQLCCALAETLLTHRLVCICFTASQADRAEAIGRGVTLLTLDLDFADGEDVFRGRGIGRTLKNAIIGEARRLGFHSLIARVADGSNASLHLNESVGFKRGQRSRDETDGLFK